MTSNKANRKTKDKASEIGKLIRGDDPQTKEGVTIDTGETVYFKDFDTVHTTQGFIDDKMFYTVPLWHDREIRDRETGEVFTAKNKRKTNFVITSNRELFRPSDKYFQEKGLIAVMPETVLEERWSKPSIKDYYKNGINVDPGIVFHKLQDTWKYYMDLEGNPGSYTALPLINALSYCIWLFQYAPYLKYEGEKGSSKSKACEIHEYIDFNAYSGVDQTPAVIYRTLQDTRGTLIIDEAENYDKMSNKSEYEQARESIINAGFKANGKVSRLEGNSGHFRKEDYHVFGIKIIGSIHGVSETIRDRSYQIMLRKTLNKELSKRTPRPRDPIFQEIRDMLYVMVLNHWKEIREISERDDLENRLELIGREWDKARPLVTMATFFASHDKEHAKDIMDDLWVFLEDQKNREITLTIDTFDEVVINQVEKCLNRAAKDEGLEKPDQRDFTIPLGDISIGIAEEEGKKDSPKFNLRAYSRSIRKKVEKLAIGFDFRHGTGNTTVFKTNIDLISNARKRFNIAVPQSKSEGVSNSINFDNLINSINYINSYLKTVEVNFNKSPELVNQVNQKNNDNILINSLLNQEKAALLKDRVKELKKLINGNGEDKPHENDQEPVKPDAVMENYITEEEGRKIIDSLLESGIHLKANDSGKSSDGRKFSIAIPKSYYDKHQEDVSKKMESFGFIRSGNSGAFGNIFYERPMKEVVS